MPTIAIQCVLGFALIAAIVTYPKWSYKQWAYRCERDVIPFAGRKKEGAK
ncbi:MAG: hypothetical protein K0Q85_8 [Caproiciproducens sp.]|jgi:membrane protein YdbS with pleckstrin-like domain|nr:hypothetical protein [Caproiciproducens sp.]